MPLLKSIKNLYKVEPSEFSPNAALDEIYKIEQVDVRSIRTLSLPEPVLLEPFIENVSQAIGEPDLGLLPEGKTSINSFILEEPISVLDLSQHVEKLLFSMNIPLINDLLNLDFSSLIHVKGMGQGHIEELKDKLQKYIAGRVLRGCSEIDFESWVKSLMPRDKKRCFLVLDTYDLSHLVSLSPSESVEIRRLTLGSKAEWLLEGRSAFNTYDRQHFFKERLHEIINVFLRPWMLKRGGFVKKEDLFERMDRLSLKKDTFFKSYTFFKEIFFEGKCPLEELMTYTAPYFFARSHLLDSFLQVTDSLNSYFYRPSVSYPLNQLTALLEKELAQKWIGFPDGFVEKVIHSSFNVIRGNTSLIVLKKGV